MILRAAKSGKTLASVLIRADAPQQTLLCNNSTTTIRVKVRWGLLVVGRVPRAHQRRDFADTTGLLEICDGVPGVQPKEGYVRRGRSRGSRERVAPSLLSEQRTGEVLRAVHGSSRSSVRRAGSLCSP